MFPIGPIPDVLGVRRDGSEFFVDVADHGVVRVVVRPLNLGELQGQLISVKDRVPFEVDHAASQAVRAVLEGRDLSRPSDELPDAGDESSTDGS